MIAPISKRRRVLLAEYEVITREWRALPENNLCAVCHVRRAEKKPHHVIPRSVRPDLVCEPENFLPVCYWVCHLKIHNNPEWAYRMGYLGHSWDDLRELKKLRERATAMPK